MRKLIAVLAACAVVASMSSTALAGKPKKVAGSFSATLAPGPIVGGCKEGVEGVHKVSQEFTSPGKGTLRVWMEGFTGDHDLYLLVDGDVYAKSENDQGPVNSAPAEEEIYYTMKKGETFTMVACNWIGGPEVTAHYEGTFK